jgi:branched-chain amino acid transport system substrate-binding protein
MRTKKMWRVTILVGATLAALAVAAVAIASSTAKSQIKVGFLIPLTGPFAANGIEESNGFNLGLRHFGSNVAGHRIAVKYADTQRDPATALAQARALVENWGADIMQGPLGANEVIPVAPYLISKGVPVDDLTLCSAEQLANYQKYNMGYTSAWACDTPGMMGGQWAAKVKKWKHVTVVAFDYAFGWELAGGFSKVFKKNGGTIDKFIWLPSNALDMSPYVSQIPKDTEAVWVVAGGAIAVNFIKAYDSFGLRGKIPVMGPILSDYSALPGQGDLGAGTLMNLHYCDGLQNKANIEFVKEYKAKYNSYPGYYAEAGYTKARILINALKRLKGDVSDKKKVITAMRTINISDTPRGPIRLSSEFGAPIQNVYICQVKRVNGDLRNVPLYTFKNVQPWGPLSKQEWLDHFNHDSAGRPE